MDQQTKKVLIVGFNTGLWDLMPWERCGLSWRPREAEAGISFADDCAMEEQYGGWIITFYVSTPHFGEMKFTCRYFPRSAADRHLCELAALEDLAYNNGAEFRDKMITTERRMAA